ncbi:MAG: peptide chain release factor N(5)-glutamine methyltransferase [Patescibacteria group bacterium]|nr:peptide chain release factor N(5)-glutamine methyltransferase [Patescibacteria group bacterium]MDD5490325.1 peptide chain release factor N(5)-glutamine methyltransferase [Patescibacteria group bacterium]
MTIKQALKKYATELKKFSYSPVLDTEVLLQFILKKDRVFLYAHPEIKLSVSQAKKLKKLAARAKKHEPIAYLVGEQEFYKLNFKVNKDVLIPRPETETLVEEAINYIKKYKLKSIADIGTGSGAIIVSIAKNTDLKNYYATDISASTLKIARQNAGRHGLEKQITFLQGDLLELIHNSTFVPSSGRGKFLIPNSNFIIVANLPYLNKKEMAFPGLKYEPRGALDGGPDGLDKFREFFAQLKLLKCQPQIIILEIGWKQAARLKKLVPKNYRVQIKKDLCGRERVMVLKYCQKK